MPTSFKRVAVQLVVAVCLLLVLATGAFLVSGASLRGAHVAHSASPLATTCGGGVGTPC